MRQASSIVLGLALLVPVALSAQTPARKPPVVKKTNPTAPTAPNDLAQLATDSVLGPNAATVAAVMAAMVAAGATGVPTCGAGLVPYPVLNAASVTGGRAVAPGLGATKFLCGTPEQAIASIQAAVAGAQAAQTAAIGAQAGRAGLAAQAMQAAQGGLAGQTGLAAQAMQAAQGGLTGQAAGLAAQAAAAGQTGMPSVGSMLAATPQGMMVNAAAPMAGAAAKKLGGFLRGSQSKESMAGDLAKGKLVLKAVKFVEGTDMFVSDAEAEFPALAEAVKAVEGQFILNVPAESDGKTAPDTVMAKRRLAKIAAQLIAAGVSADRVTTRGVQPPGLDAKNSAPKPGSARAELIRVPTEARP
jgi:hypothetical protein